MNVPSRIENLDQLSSLYGQPSERAASKVFSTINETCSQFESTEAADVRACLAEEYAADLEKDS